MAGVKDIKERVKDMVFVGMGEVLWDVLPACGGMASALPSYSRRAL